MVEKLGLFISKQLVIIIILKNILPLDMLSLKWFLIFYQIYGFRVETIKF